MGKVLPAGLKRIAKAGAVVIETETVLQAGTDRASQSAGLMLKTQDVALTRNRLLELGLSVGELHTGQHERRFEVVAPGGAAVVFYSK